MVERDRESSKARIAMKSPFYTAEHDAFRDVMRRFVDKEIDAVRP